MRLTLATPLLVALLGLAACSGTTGSNGNDEQFDANCAEQSQLATNGTTEGGLITITCP